MYLLEKVPDTGGTHTDKHLHKLRAGDGEEGHARLAGDGLSQQGLSGTRGTDQEHTLGNLGTDCREALGPLQELNNLQIHRVRPAPQQSQEIYPRRTTSWAPEQNTELVEVNNATETSDLADV